MVLFVCKKLNYLTSTVAPASSSFALMSLASSWETPSLTGFGAPSTRAFASLSPSPVISLTTLITLTFSCPALESFWFTFPITEVITTAVGFIMYSKSRFGRRLSNGYTI